MELGFSQVPQVSDHLRPRGRLVDSGLILGPKRMEQGMDIGKIYTLRWNIIETLIDFQSEPGVKKKQLITKYTCCDVCDTCLLILITTSMSVCGLPFKPSVRISLCVCLYIYTGKYTRIVVFVYVY